MAVKKNKRVHHQDIRVLYVNPAHKNAGHMTLHGFNSYANERGSGTAIVKRDVKNVPLVFSPDQTEGDFMMAWVSDTAENRKVLEEQCSDVKGNAKKGIEARAAVLKIDYDRANAPAVPAPPAGAVRKISAPGYSYDQMLAAGWTDRQLLDSEEYSHLVPAEIKALDAPVPPPPTGAPSSQGELSSEGGLGGLDVGANYDEMDEAQLIAVLQKNDIGLPDEYDEAKLRDICKDLVG